MLTNHFISRRYICSSILVVVALAGCGGTPDDAPDLFQVTGNVTLDGNPLENGEILMMPASGSGRPDAGRIENGKFTLKCTAGPKRVEITATKEVPAADPGGIPDYISIIPSRYNDETELTANIEANDENSVDFPLDSK